MTQAKKQTSPLMRLRAAFRKVFASGGTATDLVPRSLERRLYVHLLAGPEEMRSGQTPDPMIITASGTTRNYGPIGHFGDYILTARQNLDLEVSEIFEKAGQTGLTIDDVFYPHSRIDRIVKGEIHVLAEGSDGA